MKVEIINLLNMLETMVNNGGKVPFSNKVTVDKEEVMSVINEMRSNLPSDIRAAQEVVS